MRPQPVRPTVEKDATLKRSALLPVAAAFLVLLVLPSFIPSYYVYLFTLIYITALLATSLNFCLGYGGLLQLHHAVFYGLGAYTVAITAVRTSLPLWCGLLLGPLVAAAIGWVMGWFCVRLRGLYFGMLMLALGQLVWTVVYRWYEFTGGDDGIHGLSMPRLIDSLTGCYYLTLVVFFVCLGIMYLMVNSPFGVTLQATRDNPVRSESIGINIRRHQLASFVIAAFFAGVAGVLFVVLERSVSPALLFWSKSAEVLIMCLLGGMSTFLGPSLGAAAVVVLSTVIGIHTEYWLIVLGVILLVLVLFLPQGILGYLEERIGSGRGLKGASEDYVEG